MSANESEDDDFELDLEEDAEADGSDQEQNTNGVEDGTEEGDDVRRTIPDHLPRTD